MNHIIRANTIVLSFAAIAAIASPVSAQGNCMTYGKVALKQVVAAEKLKCGFTGARWSKNLAAHIAWCANVGPAEWRSELKKRNLELKKCAG